MKQSVDLSNIYLMVALLYDKMYSSSHGANRLSMSDKEYRTTLTMYEEAIEKDTIGNYHSIHFALLCNLHTNQGHAAAAMTALDNFNNVLDENLDQEKMWHEMLDSVREMKDKQVVSLPESGQHHFEMTNIKAIFQENNTRPISTISIMLLIDKISVLEKLEENRNQVKIDKQYFANDRNGNRSLFYHEMRVFLSHSFAGMAVTSGGGGEPLVKHDRTGTKTL
jgi:hypothetical protein